MRQKAGLFCWVICILCILLQEASTWSHSLSSHPLGLRIEGDAETVLVTHGGIASKESMLAYAYAFADQGYSVILADLWGHGGNRKPFPLKGKSCKWLKRKWGAEVKPHKPQVAIGHSLGARFLCKNGIRASTKIYVGKGEACGKTSIHGTLFPTYHIDHLLEPWNLLQIRDAVNIGADRKRRKKNPPDMVMLGLYSLLPWVVFLSGMVGLISLQPQIRRGASKRGKALEADWIQGVMAASLFILAFALLTWRRLWYPLPIQTSDWLTMAAYGIPAVVGTLVLQRIPKIGPWLSQAFVLGFAVLFAFLLKEMWTGSCPDRGVIYYAPFVLSLLFICIAVLSQIIGLKTPARAWMQLVFASYVLALGFPSFSLF